MPWVLTRFVKKQQDKFNKMNGFGSTGYDQTKEGEVHIKDSQSQKTSNEDNQFGEYVDFEEVDD